MKNIFAKVRFMAVLIGIIAAFMIFLCTRPSREKQIVAFVEENKLQLTDIAQNMMDGDLSKKTFKKAKMDGVFRNSESEEIVQFTCTGKGIIPASKYYGFYYSPSDQPQAFQNVDVNLEAENGYWKWHDEGDNGGITKKIGNGWYYYEAWF